jgi:hypothetical protein
MASGKHSQFAIEMVIGIVDLPIKDSDFPIKNGDLPIKNGDLPIKNCDFPIKNGDFPSFCVCLPGRVFLHTADLPARTPRCA